MNDQQKVVAKERGRMAGLVDQFLLPLIPKGSEVLSIGCGAGVDVLELRARGVAAWGLDPSRLTVDAVPDEARSWFATGVAESRPFGDRKFDFAYSFDVIEHVGCRDFGTHKLPDAENTRIAYVAACLDTLHENGRLLMVTPNRLCPVDFGHWHAYHPLGRALKGRSKLGLSIPWDPRNFLVSRSEVKNLVERTGRLDLKVRLIDVRRYPKPGRAAGLKGTAVRAALYLGDIPILAGSPIAPVLGMLISR